MIEHTIWCKVKDSYNLVSINGNVITLGERPGYLKGVISNWGYIRVGIRRYGNRKQERVHRLVMQAFTSNPLNKPQVNHINSIKTDNRVENLEWCTNQENSDHRWNK